MNLLFKFPTYYLKIAEKIPMRANNKIWKKAQYAITSSMGENLVTSRTFCEKVGGRRNELTI